MVLEILKNDCKNKRMHATYRTYCIYYTCRKPSLLTVMCKNWFYQILYQLDLITIAVEVLGDVWKPFGSCILKQALFLTKRLSFCSV